MEEINDIEPKIPIFIDLPLIEDICIKKCIRRI